VCSHETWGEVYKRVSELVLEHRTTLVFVQTRKLAERVAAQLATLLGEGKVTCHHSSLAKERRLLAEQRLKKGELSALVATASLELGIDIGDVDPCASSTPRSIATPCSASAAPATASAHAAGVLPADAGRAGGGCRALPRAQERDARPDADAAAGARRARPADRGGVRGRSLEVG
jgi:replicative superfamily II helicase